MVIAGADKGAVDEEIRSACAAHIEEEKSIGATVTVVSVTEMELPVTAAVTLMEGYSTEDVTNQLTAAVSALLTSQPFGQAVVIPYSRFLACLLQCAGVADYKLLHGKQRNGSRVGRCGGCPGGRDCEHHRDIRRAAI